MGCVGYTKWNTFIPWYFSVPASTNLLQIPNDAKRVYFNVHWENGKSLNFRTFAPSAMDDPTLAKTLANQVSRDLKAFVGQKKIRITKIEALSKGKFQFD